jgi:hypothetical protein
MSRKPGNPEVVIAKGTRMYNRNSVSDFTDFLYHNAKITLP